MLSRRCEASGLGSYSKRWFAAVAKLRATELGLGLVPLPVDCPGSILKIWLLESPYFLPMLFACKFCSCPVRLISKSYSLGEIIVIVTGCQACFREFILFD